MPPLALHDVVRGQYDGHPQQDGVARSSATETFVALRAFVENPRRAGVPFYLRTGTGSFLVAREFVRSLEGPGSLTFIASAGGLRGGAYYTAYEQIAALAQRVLRGSQGAVSRRPSEHENAHRIHRDLLGARRGVRLRREREQPAEVGDRLRQCSSSRGPRPGRFGGATRRAGAAWKADDAARLPGRAWRSHGRVARRRDRPSRPRRSSPSSRCATCARGPRGRRRPFPRRAWRRTRGSRRGSSRWHGEARSAGRSSRAGR